MVALCYNMMHTMKRLCGWHIYTCEEVGMNLFLHQSSNGSSHCAVGAMGVVITPYVPHWRTTPILMLHA